MEKITIQIAGVDYVIKKSFRSLMLFEQLSKKNVDEIGESVTDLMMLFYCILKANNKHFEFEFEDFIDLIDDNQDTMDIFSEYIENQASEKQEQPQKKRGKNH